MNKKKTVKEKKVKGAKTPKFDDSIRHEFRCNVRVGPEQLEHIDFTIEPPAEDEGHMTYDCVEFAAMDEMELRYPHDYYPKRDIDGYIFIKNEKGEWSPVVSESDKDGINELKKSNTYSRFLVLPDATYSITPEYALYMAMTENGIIDKDKVDFDFDKMLKMLKMLKDITIPKMKKEKRQ